MSATPLHVSISVDTHQFALSMQELTAVIERLGVLAARAGASFRKFAYWMDYGMFFNRPDPSADLLALVEARWPR